MNFFKLLILSVLIPCFTFAGSPIIFGPTGPTSLANGGVMFPDGSLVKDSGSKNLVRNSTAENGLTTGYTLSKNTSAAATPDSGFVTTSLSNTFAVSATTPIEGAKSFLWTLAALGEQVCYPFTIDNGDQTKMIRGNIDYAIASGTFADDAATVWVYDVTNAAWIQPAPYLLKNHSLAKEAFAFEFQAAYNSVSYKVCLHQAAASTAALRIDNVQVGPQVARGHGSVVTDTKAVIMTCTNCGNAVVSDAFESIVGDKAFYSAKITMGSSLPTGTINVVLPSNRVIDTTKLNVTGLANALGVANAISGGGYRDGTVTYGSSTSVFIISPASTANTWNATIPATWSNGEYFTVNFSVPIVGFSAQSQIISTDSPNGVVLFRASNSSATTTAIPNGATPTAIANLTATEDSVGGWNGSDTYTVKVPGKYSISGSIYTSSSITSYVDMGFIVGGVYKETTSIVNNTISTTITGEWEGDLTAGTTIKLGTYHGDGVSRSYGAYSPTWLSVKLLQGPSQILAASSVSATYTNYTTQQTGINPNGTWALMSFTDKIKDSHGSWNGSRFSPPVAATYSIKGVISIYGTNILAGGRYISAIHKNGSEAIRGSQVITAAGEFIGLAFAGDIPLLPTDYIEIKLYGSGNNSVSTLSSDSGNISISNIGNY